MDKNNQLSIFNESVNGGQFTSFTPDDLAGKKRLYNAINSPDERISAMINKQIDLVDVVITKVTLSEKKGNPDDFSNFQDEDREPRKGYRVILIDNMGRSYTATSQGIYNSICMLLNVFGTLHFDEPLKVEIKQISTKNGSTLTLTLAD